jgi:hypothetical protein
VERIFRKINLASAAGASKLAGWKSDALSGSAAVQ